MRRFVKIERDFLSRMMKSKLETLQKAMFFISVAVIIYIFGIVSHKFDLFPYAQVRDASRSLFVMKESFSIDQTLYRFDKDQAEQITNLFPERLAAGLILVTGVAEERTNFIRIMDRGGNVIHEIRPNWFDIWNTNEGDFPQWRRPQKPPGALLHGLDVMDNGDLVFNFEHLSTMRMNPCGDVVWKLDNLGHHSVHLAEDDTLWVASETYFHTGPTEFRNQTAPLRSWSLQNISADGDILKTIPVIDILIQNDLYGLLTLSTQSNKTTEVSGDTLHLNDIDIFPSHLSSSVFEAGDIMFSLRNINTVMVIDGETYELKFRTTGEVLRQHDPDFLDGDRISVFDNHNMMPSGGLSTQFSRIVEFDARTAQRTVVVDGAKDTPFFTDIMGVHQRLPNGNILITSASEGRILEVLPDGTLAWSYTNKIGDGMIGRLTFAMILPATFDVDFYQSRREQCR